MNPTQPAVRKVLELSTAHLPEQMYAELNGYDGVVADPLPYGTLLWVPDDPDEHAAGYGDEPEVFDGVPPEVLAVQRYARAQGCDHVRFDCDAATIPDLPTWDW